VLSSGGRFPFQVCPGALHFIGPVRRIVEQPCIRCGSKPDRNKIELGCSMARYLGGVDAFPYVIDFFDGCQGFSLFHEFLGLMSGLCGIRLISITLHRVESCGIPLRKTAMDGPLPVLLSGQMGGELASDGQSAENPDHV
jgi:hypothetical protein